MKKQWSSSVRKSGKLLVFASSTGSSGWSVVLERSIKEFNRAARARGLKMRISRTTEESKAQLTFGIGSEKHFSSSTHGLTSLTSGEQDGIIIKGVILIHPNPQVQVAQKKPGSKEYEMGWRAAGENIRVILLVHEFIHAFGLEEHSDKYAQDVFYSPLQPNGGDRSSGDFMDVPIPHGKRFPPIIISAATGGRLKDVWT